MVLAHVVWIIPLQRSQSRWGRRRVGWQARRKIRGHSGFLPLTFGRFMYPFQISVFTIHTFLFEYLISQKFNATSVDILLKDTFAS